MYLYFLYMLFPGINDSTLPFICYTVIYMVRVEVRAGLSTI